MSIVIAVFVIIIVIVIVIVIVPVVNFVAIVSLLFIWIIVPFIVFVVLVNGTLQVISGLGVLLPPVPAVQIAKSTTALSELADLHECLIRQRRDRNGIAIRGLKVQVVLGGVS